MLVSLAVFLFLALNRNRRLVHDKETLILKNDSLHILHIETSSVLLITQKKLDSFISAQGSRHAGKK